ncbi:MAG: HAD-IC family P-type ATPase [Candidatus Nealsonbacteria bacterium]|nr:HAD-IC family P-type ATPase [Candidatus Nealsonbacteria bacterium]
MAEIFWHNVSSEEAVKQLNSDSGQGLSDKEVFLRQEKFGRNQLPEEKRLPGLKIFFSQLKSPLIYILIIAGLITLFFGKFADSIVIFGAVVLNTVIGFIQENKSSRALRALKEIVRIEARVIRDGIEKSVDSAELVPGDMIVFTAGNKIPADARLVESHHLMVNEAPLTGESMPAQKSNIILPLGDPMVDRDNMVYMGCTVENGLGKAVITAIGRDTEIGKVSLLTKETKEEKTPLQEKISQLSKIIGLIIGIFSSFIFIGGILKGRDFLETFMTSIAVAVAAIPEGLPIALTVILALGTQRILKRKGLVRRLASAEVLGSTSIIASDKTLTLTEGKMKVSEIYAEDKNLLLKIVVLTSEVSGGPTEKALLSAGAEAGFKKDELNKSYFKRDEIPFDPKNKFVAVLVETKEKKQLILVSGAPEKILSRSLLKDGDASKLNRELEKLASDGLRVVAAAYKKISDHKTEIENLNNEISGLTFVGFIGLRDPLRPEAKEAIFLCRKAGMKPIIVTGDHLLTAKVIAGELEMKTGRENVIEGRELDDISDEEFYKKIKDIEVYARVEPRHKLRIVEAWQKLGQVVAMTGDGINDAPALKKADIGVALGSGTDAAKEVSDLVLLTDSFNIIISAVEEGRVIIDNIRKVITYLLSDSFTETILIGAAVIFGWPLPVSAVQILWINLIEDGFPNIALAFEPKDKAILERKPEIRNVKLLNPEMKAIIFIIGLITDFMLLFIFWWLFRQNYDMQYIRTIIFATLGIDSLFYVFSCKSLRKNIWRINLFSNKLLIASVIFGFTALLAGIYIPVFQSLLDTVPLGRGEWLIVLGLGALNVALIELVKYIFIIKRKK